MANEDVPFKMETVNCESTELKSQVTTEHLPVSLIGKKFAGKFQILSIIGSGGMSVIYQAKHLVLNKIVALKVLQVDRLKDPRDIHRFQQEAQAAISLSHPNIGPVREFGLDEDSHPYIVMDFIDAVPLSILVKEQALTPARALQIALGVCQGLEHAHGHGVVHRDIKPENILIAKSSTGSDVPMIVDFGIARITLAGENSTRLTQTGQLFGTPAYMSPEQAMGYIVDARSDIYALGTVMYEMLSGKRPFTAENPLIMVMKQISEAPPPLNSIPAEIRSIVMKAMAKDPNLRYDSATALRIAIENVVSNKLVINLPEWNYSKTLMLRAVAWIIDTLIVGMPGLIIACLLSPALSTFPARIAAFSGIFDQCVPSMGAIFVSEAFPGDLGWLVVGLIITSVNYLYHALLESSERRATIGKQWLGLVTTSTSFERLSFREASLRHWSKSIYWVPFMLSSHILARIPMPESLVQVRTYLALLFSSAIVAIVACILRKRYQMLHDCVAVSMVVPGKQRPRLALNNVLIERPERDEVVPHD